MIIDIPTLQTALSEALHEWAYASQYKGAHLQAKHGDLERIAELRQLCARLDVPTARDGAGAATDATCWYATRDVDTLRDGQLSEVAQFELQEGS